jgi:hypothetical protein
MEGGCLRALIVRPPGAVYVHRHPVGEGVLYLEVCRCASRSHRGELVGATRAARRT